MVLDTRDFLILNTNMTFIYLERNALAPVHTHHQNYTPSMEVYHNSVSSQVQSSTHATDTHTELAQFVYGLPVTFPCAH